jgi:hypothetical protein
LLQRSEQQLQANAQSGTPILDEAQALVEMDGLFILGLWPHQLRCSVTKFIILETNSRGEMWREPTQKVKTAEVDGSERAKRTADKVKDQVIVALRCRLEEMKLQLAAKDQELCGKQRAIDPSHWTKLRDRWATLHATRFVLAAIRLSALILSVLIG